MIHVRPLKRSQSLKDMAYGQVKGLLRAGKMGGDTIFSANQLADNLGVSRTPVREALLQLSAEGFLTALGSKGFRVRQFTHKEIADTFEAREAIESWVVQQLAGRKDFDSAPLAQALVQMEQAAQTEDVNGFMRADEAFHLYLARSHDNGLLTAVMENIRDRISLLGHQALAVQGRMKQVLDEHRRILAALRQHDRRKAAESMSEHLAATQRNLMLILASEVLEDAP